MQQLASAPFVCLFCFGLSSACAQSVQSVPSEAEQKKVLEKLKSTFAKDYEKKTPKDMAALADKFVRAAKDEAKESPAKYVLFGEAIQLAIKIRDISTAITVAESIADTYGKDVGKSLLSNSLASAMDAKKYLDKFGDIADLELAKPTEPKDLATLAEKWMDSIPNLKAENRASFAWRARTLLISALRGNQLKGLQKAEYEKLCQQAEDIVEAADAKSGTFSLYQGKWLVQYENKFAHGYAISVTGDLAYEREVGPDGRDYPVANDFTNAKLVRKNGDVIVVFGKSKLIERFKISGEKLLVEHFNPATDYPKKRGMPGEGKAEE